MYLIITIPDPPEPPGYGFPGFAIAAPPPPPVYQQPVQQAPPGTPPASSPDLTMDTIQTSKFKIDL